MSLRRLKTRTPHVSRRILVFGALLVGIGIYGIVLSIAPFALPIDSASVEAALQKTPAVGENRLYIAKIGVNVPINEVIGGNDTKALLDGAAHRAPESGNPKDGGNFVLAAHRFTFGITPRNVVQQSPFLHIEKLTIGDAIYVDWAGKRYNYKVHSTGNVAPTQTEIEQRTASPILTMYSCGLAGERDNRLVVVAVPAQ